jgi:hypothetical protein
MAILREGTSGEPLKRLQAVKTDGESAQIWKRP